MCNTLHCALHMHKEREWVLNGLLCIFFNYIKSNCSMSLLSFFFCLFLPDNKFLFHWIISWRVADLPWTKKKKKECSHSTVVAGKVLFQVIDSCLEVLHWKQYKTEQLSCSILFYEAWFCADLFYVDVKLICCLFSLHTIHNDNHPMNISFTWVITNLGNCVQRQPRSLLHAVIWTCLNIQNTKSTHPWTKSWLNGLTIMHNEELLITYSE